MYSATFIDLSQFVSDPIRTGVQRVLIKAVEHFPRARIMPFRVIDQNTVAILDPLIFEICIRYFTGQESSQRARVAAVHQASNNISAEENLIRLIAQHPLAVMPAERFFHRASRIINLETFGDSNRSKFYAGCDLVYRKNVFHFMHDFLLFEEPQVFPQLNWRHAADYVLLFEAYAAAGGYFVSTPAMREKVKRYFSAPDSAVQLVHFGGDISSGHAVAAQSASGGRKRVVVLGTLEPRKYPLIVTQALDELSAAPDVECVVVGKWGWLNADERGQIEAIFAKGKVRHHIQIGDNALAELLAGTDVAIYVSSTEGFGLPVIEFAARGIPIVTNAAVPSAELVAGGNATILDAVTAPALVEAVRGRLDAGGDRTPYYNWTWQNFADEIFGSEAGARPQEDEIFWGRVSLQPPAETLEHPFNIHAAWRATAILIRRFRVKRLNWEELKVEVARHIFSPVGQDLDLYRPPIESLSQEHKGDLVEHISEVVSDNLYAIYWADIHDVRPLVAEFVRCLSVHGNLEGLIRGFQSFLGRPIDGPAAAESARITEKVWRFNRLLELIHSDEARANLGEQRATALCAVMDDTKPLMQRLLADPFNLVDLFSALGIAPPSVEDVCLTDEWLSASVERLELMLYFAHRQPPRGDRLDFFLDVVSEIMLEKGLQVDRRPKVQPAQQRIGTIFDKTEVLPRSPSRRLDVLSTRFSEGWYPPEYVGSNAFRWMGMSGIIINPETDRLLNSVTLDVQSVYGAAEPIIDCFIDGKPVNFTTEKQQNGKGWLITMKPEEASMVRKVQVDAVVSGCPARDEGTTDERDLSLCVLEAVFTYRD